MSNTTIRIDQHVQGMMDDVIVGLAHELNNPNAFIRLNAMNLKKMIQLLTPVLDEHEKTHPGEKLGPYVIQELRSKIIHLADSILDASLRIIVIADKLKQSTAALFSESSPLSLVEVIQNVISMHRFLVEKSARVEFTYSPNGKFELMGHRLQLEQAFSVLLTNACDAIAERYNVTDEVMGLIRIDLAETPEEIRVHFSDNGCGMSESVLKKIFVPYFTTKPQGVGDGLGLSICRSMVMRHGGAIEVSSQKHVGTQFLIVLPKKRPSVE